MPGTILFFGRNVSIMALVDLQMRSAGYKTEGFLEEMDLMQRLEGAPAALLVLGAGVEDAPRARLREYCEAKRIKLLEHFGGPDRLLENVRAALA